MSHQKSETGTATSTNTQPNGTKGLCTRTPRLGEGGGMLCLASRSHFNCYVWLGCPPLRVGDQKTASAALWRDFFAQTNPQKHTLSIYSISLSKIVILNRVSVQLRPYMAIYIQNNLVGLLLMRFYPGYISGLLQTAEK